MGVEGEFEWFAGHLRLPPAGNTTAAQFRPVTQFRRDTDDGAAEDRRRHPAGRPETVKTTTNDERARGPALVGHRTSGRR
ncbi:hypothetical protein JCM9957A_57410 [Kineosporia succinea]